VPPPATLGGIPTDCPRPWYNEEQNSRCPLALPAGAWAVKWSTKLRPGFPPAFVLESGDRILVEAGVWQLFDRGGKLVREGRAGTSHLAIERERGFFLLVNKDGELAAETLAEGSERFNTLLEFGDEYLRPLCVMRGTRVLLLGNERQLDPHRHHLAEHSLISAVDVSEFLAPTAPGDEAVGRRAGSLILQSTQAVGAVSGDRLVVAMPDRLLALGLDLKVRAAFSGQFQPQAISLDEAGRAHLLVQTAQGQALWVVSPAGRREMEVRVEGVEPEPPIIGWDHRVYLPAKNRLVVVDPSGRLLPDYPARGPLAGAIVTADSQILASSGKELVAYLPRGREAAPRVLWTFAAELVTPPVLTGGREILVASASELFCLALKN
jgi:hypothetical protein